MDDFERQLEVFRQLIEREKYPKLMRASYHLLGLREFRARNADKAIDHFWKALKLLPSPLGKSNADTDSARYYFAMAEAYLKSGAYSLAAEMYEKVPPYWEQRFNSGDIYARSFYGSARAHELFRVRDLLQAMNVELVGEGLRVKYVPGTDVLNQCYELGQNVAEKLKAKVGRG